MRENAKHVVHSVLFFLCFNDKLPVFPQRVLVVNRAKSKTFFAFFQNETLNL